MKPRLKSAQRSLLGRRVISSHLLTLGYDEKSVQSMLRCGSDTPNKLYYQCGCGVHEKTIKHHCSLRTCNRCAKKRKRKIKRTYLRFLQNLPQNNYVKLRFLTISPKNYKNLEEGINHIKESFIKFLRRDYIKNRIFGGLYVIETTGTEGNWNIHIHAIIYSRYLDNRIRGQCLKCGQNLLKFDYNNKKYYCSNRNCNSINIIKSKDSRLVREFRSSSKRDCTVNIQKQYNNYRRPSAQYTLNYMCKYIGANKNEFLNAEDIAKYIIATKKRRLINRFGAFYNHKYTPKNKERFICKKCEEPVYIIFDYDVMEIYNNPENKPPDLTSFFIN